MAHTDDTCEVCNGTGQIPARYETEYRAGVTGRAILDGDTMDCDECLDERIALEWVSRRGGFCAQK